MSQPTIQILAEKVIEASGIDWNLAHRTLQSYAHGLTDERFQMEVSRVTNPKIFNILWSIGLTSVRQDMCTKRAGELR